MGDKRNAEQIVWDAPGGVQMSLVPEPGGSLQVDVRNGMVEITGKQCRHSQGERAMRIKDVAHKILAEVDLTILNARCQIVWKGAESVAEADA